MTKEIAKKIVRGITDKIECNTVDIDDWAEFWGFTREEYEEFLDMAIKALGQQPCEDCISRKAVLEGLRTCYDTETKEFSDGSEWINYEDAIAEIEDIPSVTPQPKTGK